MNDERPFFYPPHAAPDEEARREAGLARALQSIEAPPELPQRLIAAMRAAADESGPPPELQQRILSAVRAAAPQRVTRRGWMLGFSAAAAAAIAAGGSYWWARHRRPLTLEDLTERLAAIAGGGVRLALRTPDRQAIAAWMQQEQAPRAESYPAALDALGRKGCQQYYVAGHPVSLECFVLPGGALIHVFCTGAHELTNPPAAGAAPLVYHHRHHTIATWTRGPSTIVLLTHESLSRIQPLLA